MELAFVLVLGIAGSLTASPHGYGAKSGAVATAGAVAFAGVPTLPVNGGGAVGGGLTLGNAGDAAAPGGSYSSSGSFSKSSASSFASSSASSFSYSGGYQGGNKPGGYQGAQAGYQGAPGSGPGGYQGTPSGPGGYTSQANGGGANSAAGAAAGDGYHGYPDSTNIEICGAAGCDNSANKPDASAGKIPTGLNFNGAHSTSGAAAGASGANVFTAPGGSDCGSSKCSSIPDKKCTSGNCGPTAQLSQNDNDIAVNIPSYSGTKTSYDADAQSQYLNTKNPAICSGGNCDNSGTGANTNANSGAQPDYFPQGNNKCTGPSCNYPYSAGPNADNRPSYNQPSTFLTAPKDTKPEPCLSGNCGGANVPSNNYPNYNPQQATKHKCNSPNCESLHGSVSNSNAGSNANADSGSYANNYNPQGTKCISPNCESGPTPNYSPNYPQGTKCTSPNCNLPSQNSPNYPNNPQAPQQFDHGPINSGSNCGSSGCGGLPGTQANAGAIAPAGSYKPTYPGHNKAPNTQPIYTGGFGAPSGVLSPSNPSYIQPQQPSPSYTQPQQPSPSYTQPQQPSPSYTQPQQPSPSYTQPQQSSPSYTQPQQPSPSYPSASSGSYQPGNSQPIYTGGFGGPSGVLKPNEYSSPSNPGFIQPKPTSPTSFPSSGSTTSPSNDDELNFVPLKPNNGAPSNNAYGQQQHTGAGSSAIATAGATAGAYSGGFGGPPGFLKPYDNGDKGASLTHKYNKPGYAGQGNGINNHNALAGNSYNAGAGGGAGTFAGAGAVAGAGSFGGNGHFDKGVVSHNGGNVQPSGGCSGGCQQGGGYGGHGFNLGGSFGLSKTGLLDGIAGGLHAAGAAAKSIAGAVSSAGAGSLGLSGSFAGSAAHSSAGTYKGGYGGR